MRPRDLVHDLAEEENRLEMTPMIDVTFLLLVFFLCTIRFKTLDQKLSAYLPENAGSGEEVVLCERVTVEIRVREPGQRRDAADPTRAWSGVGPFRFVGRVIEWRVGPHSYTDDDAMVERLCYLHASDPERGAVIDARPGAVYSDAVRALDAVRLAGFEAVEFVGERR